MKLLRLGIHFRRVFACFSLFFFLFHSVCQDFGFSAVGDLNDALVRDLDLASFRLPLYMGEVEEVFEGFNGKTVVHIRDIHCNYSAQQSTERIVSYLNKRYGLTLVGMEGAQGNYDLSPFTGIKDVEIRKRVADYFMKEGRINGVEKFSVLNPGAVTMKGIEEEGLYLKNLSVFRKNLAFKEEVDENFNLMSEDILRLKKVIYTPDLQKLDDNSRKFSADELSLREYLTYLLDLTGANNISIMEYETISKLSKVLEESSNIDLDRCQSEQRNLIADIERIASQIEIENLLSWTLKHRIGTIDADTFYVYLLEKGESCHIDIEKQFPTLIRYSRFLKTYNSLDKKKILSEFAELDERLFKVMKANDEQEELSRVSKQLSLLKKLFSVQFSRDDYEYYLANKSQFKTDVFTSFVQKKIKKYNLESNLTGNFSMLDDYRIEIEKFYEYAVMRDIVFFNNLKQQMRVMDTDEAVLFCGGFHSKVLKERLRQEGYSFIVITPKVETIEESQYYNLLSGEKSRFEEIIMKEFSAIALPSLLNHLGAGNEIFELLVRARTAIEEGENLIINTSKGCIVISMAGEEGVFPDRLPVRQEIYTFEDGVSVNISIYSERFPVLPAIGKEAEARASTLKFNSEDRNEAEIGVFVPETDEKLGELNLERREKDLKRIRRGIESEIMSDENREVVHSILGMFEAEKPEFYTFSKLIKDLFGFTAPRRLNRSDKSLFAWLLQYIKSFFNPSLAVTPIIALHEEFIDEPIAVFHEIGEYMIKTGKMELGFEEDELIVSVGGILQSKIDLSKQTLDFIESENWKAGWENNPYYLLRVLQREIFREKDEEVSERIEKRREWFNNRVIYIMALEDLTNKTDDPDWDISVRKYAKEALTIINKAILDAGGEVLVDLDETGEKGKFLSEGIVTLRREGTPKSDIEEIEKVFADKKTMHLSAIRELGKRYASLIMGTGKVPKGISVIEAKVDHEFYLERSEAIKALGKIYESIIYKTGKIPEGISLIEKRLKDEEVSVRKEAVIALGKIYTAIINKTGIRPEGVEAVKLLMEDDDLMVCEAAYGAIGLVFGAIINSTGEIPEEVSGIEAKMGDLSWEVRRMAFKALSKIYNVMIGSGLNPNIPNNNLELKLYIKAIEGNLTAEIVWEDVSEEERRRSSSWSDECLPFHEEIVNEYMRCDDPNEFLGLLLKIQEFRQCDIYYIFNRYVLKVYKDRSELSDLIGVLERWKKNGLALNALISLSKNPLIYRLGIKKEQIHSLIKEIIFCRTPLYADLLKNTFSIKIIENEEYRMVREFVFNTEIDIHRRMYVLKDYFEMMTIAELLKEEDDDSSGVVKQLKGLIAEKVNKCNGFINDFKLEKRSIRSLCTGISKELVSIRAGLIEFIMDRRLNDTEKKILGEKRLMNKISRIAALVATIDRGAKFKEADKARSFLKGTLEELFKHYDPAKSDSVEKAISEVNRWVLSRNSEIYEKLVSSGYKKELWSKGIEVKMELSKGLSEEERREQILNSTVELVEIALRNGMKMIGDEELTLDYSRNLHSSEKANEFFKSMLIEVDVPMYDMERINYILRSVETLESQKTGEKIKPRTFRVVIKKDFFNEALAGLGVRGCYAPNGVHREMPFVHAAEANAGFIQVFNQSGKQVANAVVVFTEEGAYVYAGYNGSAYNMDPIFGEALKELSRFVPKIIFLRNSAGATSILKYANIESLKLYKPSVLFKNQYFDYGEVDKHGNLSLSGEFLVVTEESIRTGGGFKDKKPDKIKDSSSAIGKEAKVRLSTIKYTTEDKSEAEVTVFEPRTKKNIGKLKITKKKIDLNKIEKRIKEEIGNTKHRDVVLAILGQFKILPLLKIKKPEFYTFSTLIKDLFGFASAPMPKDMNVSRLIALHEDFINDPVAVFHEIAEYLIKTERIEISLENGELEISYAKAVNVHISLSDDTLRFIKKEKWKKGWEKNPHYLLRVLQREVFGDSDKNFTQRLRFAKTKVLINRLQDIASPAIRKDDKQIHTILIIGDKAYKSEEELEELMTDGAVTGLCHSLKDNFHKRGNNVHICRSYREASEILEGIEDKDWKNIFIYIDPRVEDEECKADLDRYIKMKLVTEEDGSVFMASPVFGYTAYSQLYAEFIERIEFLQSKEGRTSEEMAKDERLMDLAERMAKIMKEMTQTDTEIDQLKDQITGLEKGIARIVEGLKEKEELTNLVEEFLNTYESPHNWLLPPVRAPDWEEIDDYLRIQRAIAVAA